MEKRWEMMDNERKQDWKKETPGLLARMLRKE